MTLDLLYRAPHQVHRAMLEALQAHRSFSRVRFQQ